MIEMMPDSGHYKKVLALNECNLYALPIQDYIILRPIEANTAVPVLDTVISSDNNIWLYVEVLALDTPMNYKGWIQGVRYCPPYRRKPLSGP